MAASTRLSLTFEPPCGCSSSKEPGAVQPDMRGLPISVAIDPERTSRSGRLPILPEHRAGGFYLKLPTNLIMFRWLEGIGMLREIMPRGRDMEAVFVDTIVNRPCNLGH
jgi:hypothetical protein